MIFGVVVRRTTPIISYSIFAMLVWLIVRDRKRRDYPAAKRFGFRARYATRDGDLAMRFHIDSYEH